MEPPLEETRALPPSWGDPEGGVSGAGLLRDSDSLARITHFGPYRVVRILAKGGMGAVFEVEHEGVGARYALKTILGSPESPGFERACERFRREAELSARLDHPHVLAVHSASLSGDRPYLVVDLLQGGSLAERLERGGPLSVADGVAITLPLLSALRHAHERGILHRDLKPENVMFDILGAVRLVDFGLALELGRQSRLTQSGSAVGTPLTMAPEQLTGERGESSATDVYGLAATIYWILAGEPPLGTGEEGITALMAAIVSREPTPLIKHRADVPRALSALLQDSLRKDPALRPSLPEWQTVLQGHLAPRPPRWRSLLLAAVGAACVLFLGLALWAGQQPSPSLPSLIPAESPPTGGLEQSASWRDACARAWTAGDRVAARQALLSSAEPLSEAEVPFALGLLSGAPLDDPQEFDALRPRLGALSDASGPPLWALICVAGGRLELGVRLARRGSVARELLELERLRLIVEREHAIPRLSSLSLSFQRGESERVFDELLRTSLAWKPTRRGSLSPAERALAELVLDQVEGTVAALAFALRQSERVHDTGGGTRQACLELLRELELPLDSIGSILLRLLLASDQEALDPSYFPLWLAALPREEALAARPGGTILLGTHGLRHAPTPGDAIRLGQLAYEQTQPLGDLSRHAQALAPYLIRRRLEAAWLTGAEHSGHEFSQAEELATRRIATNHRDLFPALLCLGLHRRDLNKARATLLKAGELRREGGSEFERALDLLESELLLAEDPALNARAVLSRHTPPHEHFLEEWGLRAHAKAILGESPQEDLNELERRRALGAIRLGLPWHAFEVPRVLKGARWWPGLPR